MEKLKKVTLIFFTLGILWLLLLIYSLPTMLGIDFEFKFIYMSPSILLLVSGYASWKFKKWNQKLILIAGLIAIAIIILLVFAKIFTCC
jgi:hypothetical protein